jgi:ribosomal protein S27AE
LFTTTSVLGCGYVGNTDVVHISTAWACGPCGYTALI